MSTPSPYQSAGEFYVPPPRRRRIWPLALGGCAVIAVLLLVACGGFLYLGYRQVSGDGDVSVEVDQLFAEIAQGRSAAYYRNHTSAEMRKAMSEGAFVDLCDMIHDRLGKLQSKTVSSFRMHSENLATIVEAIYAGKFDRGDATIQTRWKQQDGRWLLEGLFIQSPLFQDGAREICPNCGEPYETGSKFCPHCGKKLTAEKQAE